VVVVVMDYGLQGGWDSLLGRSPLRGDVTRVSARTAGWEVTIHFLQ
jgi:hypothetical protein